MNLIIAGGRDFDDYDLLSRELDYLLSKTPKEIITIFVGGAKGTDTLGFIYAWNNKIDYRVFMADWTVHGKKAGILRNQQMLDAGATHLVAFWDKKSRGTADMIDRAKKAGIMVRVFYYNQEEK